MDLVKTEQCEDCADHEACFGEDGTFVPLGCPNAYRSKKPEVSSNEKPEDGQKNCP
jgi:hypothetical protein